MVATPWLVAHECSVNQSPEAVSYLTWQLFIIAKGERVCPYTEKTLSLWGPKARLLSHCKENSSYTCHPLSHCLET